MGGPIDLEQKRFESIIHDHDHEPWVTMVGWVDVSGSDWGDFRRQRAIGISSLLRRWLTNKPLSELSFDDALFKICGIHFIVYISFKIIFYLFLVTVLMIYDPEKHADKRPIGELCTTRKLAAVECCHAI